MTVEPDNTPPVEDVTDNDALSDDDNFADFDFDDPETDTDEIEEPEEIEDEADEVEAENEAEDQEAEVDQVESDHVVQMEDGTELAVSELKNGYLRQSDYTRKAQEVANERKSVQQNAQNVEGITNALVEFLQKSIPPEPSLALAASDPNRYTREKATYEAAMRQVAELIETGRQASQVNTAISEQDLQKEQQAENAALLEMFPEAKDPEKRKQFLSSAAEAAKAVGYTDEDIAGVYDSKTIALAHWAKKGMDAEKAKATVKAKAAKAPPVGSKKPAAKGAGKGNAEAMRRLMKDDSIDNAVAALMNS